MVQNGRWFVAACLAACSADGHGAPPARDGGQGQSGADAATDARVDEPLSLTFSVLTYNVAGLPQGLSSSDPEQHIPQISPRLNAFDLVLVQEDFWYHHLLVAEVDHPYRSMPYRDPPDTNDIGDGLNRFSRFAFEGFERVAWGGCHGELDCSSDCLATKGFSFARTSFAENALVDVYNLHMEAGTCPQDRVVRAAAVEQLSTEIVARSAGRALIVAGDFNLHENDTEEKAVLDAFLESTGLEDACRSLACPSPRIDRVQFRSGGGLTLRAEQWSIPEGFVDAADGSALSDHSPVAVVLRLTR